MDPHLSFCPMSGPFVYTGQPPLPSSHISPVYLRGRSSHIPTVPASAEDTRHTLAAHSHKRRPSWCTGTPTPSTITHAGGRQELLCDPQYLHPSRQNNPYLQRIPRIVTLAPASGPAQSRTLKFHSLLLPSSNEIYLDLSLSEFQPLDAKGNPIAQRILAQAATEPPIKRFEIRSHYVPQWPVILDHDAGTHLASPITLGHVLCTIHLTMQTQVTHEEWGRLGDKKMSAATEAYLQRCNRVPGDKNHIAKKGVRRVDYLHRKVMFAGLEGDRRHEGKAKFLVKSRGKMRR